MTTHKKYILQLCHGYAMPFLDVARQYASLFVDTEYHVVTVYLTGKADQEVSQQTASDTVLFLENTSKELTGLKRKQIKQLRHICQQYNFEFAIAHRYKAIFILQYIKDLPVIGVHHAFNVYQRFMRRYFIDHHQKNLCLLGVSNAIRDDIRKQLIHFPQQQIQTLYNRVNIEQISSLQLEASAARDFLKLDKDSYIFSNVGRLHPDKDQKTLIYAFAKVTEQLPNAKLIIIGKGRLEQDLKQQVQTLGLENQVLFLGVIPNAVNYFRAFDSFVLSSDHEPFGMVLLEAIIAQLPIIATNAGGAKEIIQDPQYRFNIGDSDKLAELMLMTYRLDNAQKIKINKDNMHWLEQNFTDKAVTDNFWQLPFMQQFPRLSTKPQKDV